jgi:hypothetical protein
MGHESEAAEPLDTALLPAAYADALDLQGGGSGPLLEGIIGLLRRRGLVLALDDVEHLLASAPAVAVISIGAK